MRDRLPQVPYSAAMSEATIATLSTAQTLALRGQLDTWAAEFGFDQLGVSDVDLSAHEPHVRDWLARGLHGAMGYMNEHFEARLHPEQLLPGTLRVISTRMNYLTSECEQPLRILEDPSRAYVSRYALGRDYHKVIRRRLARLAKLLDAAAARIDHRFRSFTDSAPVLEKALASKAGLGWMGKHTLLIHPRAGSFFFLGEIYTNLPLPSDDATVLDRCGACRACMTMCPTNALIANRLLDAKRCISYLTIEHKGPIDPELRPLMGNRIFGCDDCQLYCPWNRSTVSSCEVDFTPRHGLDAATLLDLFDWSEAEFLRRTEGSPIRRINFDMWRRNLAIALGNGPGSNKVRDRLRSALPGSSDLAAEHIHWAVSALETKIRHANA